MEKIGTYKVIFEDHLSPMTDAVTIDYRKTFFDEGFVVDTGRAC